MRFKFFIGCISKEDVKSKYRSLAKIHHPDKGGNEEVFKELNYEYSYFNENTYISFPISNPINSSNSDFDISSIFNNEHPFWKAAKPDYEAARRAQAKYKNAYQEAQDLAERQRQKKAKQEQEWKEEQERIKKDPWHLKKKLDSKYSIIEQLIVDGSKQLRTTKWFLMEVYKLDDLTLDHFKFIRETLNIHSRGLCNLVDSWVSESYRNYVAIQQMEWRY